MNQDNTPDKNKAPTDFVGFLIIPGGDEVFPRPADGGADNIIRNLHTSPRQFYRYLDIAYMNPEIVNKILSGKQQINVNDIYKLAKENQL